MAGTWISIVEGFGGMRVKDDMLNFNPVVPNGWKSFSFKVWFRNILLKVKVTSEGTIITNEQGSALMIRINGEKVTLNSNSTLSV